MAEGRLVIAAGGTGGHMFPAQALAEAMVARGWEVILSTDDRGARFADRFPPEVTVQQIASATFARGGVLSKMIVPFRILGGIAAAFVRFSVARPTAVVGFGGYPTIPALSAAWGLRLPRMIHEQNGVLGRVNRIFAPRVDRVACGTWPTVLPKGVAGVHTGNPVRGRLMDAAGARYRLAEDSPVHLLVIGGSQGARVLSEVVPAAVLGLSEALRARLRITQQARPEDLDAVAEIYKAAGIRAEVATFFDDMSERLAASSLVISRAGASTVAELSVVGRPAILIPYAAAMDDHQSANARALAAAEAAIVLPERGLAPGVLSAQMTAILSDPEKAARMARKARECGVEDATERLVALVEEITDGATKR